MYNYPSMRPATFILLLLATTALVIIVFSVVEKSHGSTPSTDPQAEPLLSTASPKANKYQKPKDENPMKTRAEKKHESGKKFLKYAEEKVPIFEEIFDERTFYIFAGCVAIGTCILACIGSRFLTLSDPDDPDEIIAKIRRWKLKHMEKGTPILDPDAPTETKQAEETAKETQKKSFMDFDDEDDYDSEGDNSEEERELLRRVEDKFFRGRADGQAAQTPVETAAKYTVTNI